MSESNRLPRLLLRPSTRRRSRPSNPTRLRWSPPPLPDPALHRLVSTPNAQLATLLPTVPVTRFDSPRHFATSSLDCARRPRASPSPPPRPRLSCRVARARSPFRRPCAVVLLPASFAAAAHDSAEPLASRGAHSPSSSPPSPPPRPRLSRRVARACRPSHRVHWSPPPQPQLSRRVAAWRAVIAHSRHGHGRRRPGLGWARSSGCGSR